MPVLQVFSRRPDHCFHDADGLGANGKHRFFNAGLNQSKTFILLTNQGFF